MSKTKVAGQHSCLNKKCDDHIEAGSGIIGTTPLLCVSCRFIGKAGLFGGAIIVGIIVALLKLASVL